MGSSTSLFRFRCSGFARRVLVGTPATKVLGSIAKHVSHLDVGLHAILKKGRDGISVLHWPSAVALELHGSLDPASTQSYRSVMLGQY